MTAPELLPCPFCGGRGKRATDGIWCDGVKFNRHTMFVLREDEWNRRADLAAVQPAHGVWNKCTFDLSGAGYDCVLKDGDARHAAYGEGQKVFWDGTTINADGLYILSKPALDKRIAAAQPAHVHPDPRHDVIKGLTDITANMDAMRNFIADFAAFKFDACYQNHASRPEDDGDDVTDAEPVWSWQEDARALIAQEAKP